MYAADGFAIGVIYCQGAEEIERVVKMGVRSLDLFSHKATFARM